MRAKAFLLLFAAAAPAAAQVPAGSEFQVNTSTTYGQHSPSVAMDGDGDFIVAWASGHASSFYTRVMGQRWAADGARAGSEFQISGTVFPYILPALAAAPRGNFVVTWCSAVGHPLPTSKVIGRRFAADGAPLGEEFWTPSNRAYAPAVARQPDGGFVVAWHQYEAYFTDQSDIRARRYDAGGTAVGAELVVNTYTTGPQNRPALAVGPGGAFLVVWQSAGQDGSGSGIYGQLFYADGARLGDEFRVNEATALDQSYPSVAPAGSAGFVVAWASGDQPGSGTDIHARRLDADGGPLGAEFILNSYTTSDQSFPALAADAAGNFVASWTSAGQDGSSLGVFAQRWTASGGRRGAEFRVNTFTTGIQADSTIASDPQGNFVVSWSGNGQDGQWDGVFGQRFGGLVPTALDVDTGGNHMVEPGEVVDVRPSWRNVTGASQGFGGAAVALTGPLPATYEILDGSASYGTVANGGTGACVDCYEIAIPTTTRPALHWDAVLEELITPDAQGQDHLWRIHVAGSFTDVPASNPFHRFVEVLLHNAVTGGCNATDYCPSSATTREQMAVFVLVAREASGYAPQACTTPVFGDVPASSPFCRWIEELARRGVVGGCGGANYCPGDDVTREQMAVFVLRTLDPQLDPPACTTPLFADVPPSSPFCRWIEELARRGVVTGCGGGNFCPGAPVTREQMGVFLSGTFGLLLYGP